MSVIILMVEVKSMYSIFRILKVPVVLVFICFLFGCGEKSGQTRDLSFFLNRLNTEDSWLFPIEGEKIYLASSYQPINARDCNNFLRTEVEDSSEWKVLVDIKGGGVMTRFWTAYRKGWLEGDLEIYVDDSLIVNSRLAEFFSGNYYPFIFPVVANEMESSGGRVSYFPVPFSKNLKVRSRSESKSFYWQINYSLFDDGQIESFKGKLSAKDEEALKEAAKKFVNNTVESPEKVSQNQLDIISGDSFFKELIGCGTIRSILLELPEKDREMVKDLHLEITYGKNSEPAVLASISELFHVPSIIRDYESKYMSISGGLFTFKLPIPFENGVTLKLINSGRTDMNNVILKLLYHEKCKSNMRFHAFTNSYEILYGDTLTLASISGNGVMAGLNLFTSASAKQEPDFFNQEGNEYISVDDSLVWRGTGTEDYFNSGYYYDYGEFDLPLHGCLQKDTIGGGVISVYRIHKLDAIRFTNHLQVLLEAGCPKKGAPTRKNANGLVPLNYTSTIFYYLRECS